MENEDDKNEHYCSEELGKKKNIMHTMSLYFSGKIYLKFGMNVEWMCGIKDEWMWCVQNKKKSKIITIINMCCVCLIYSLIMLCLHKYYIFIGMP